MSRTATPEQQWERWRDKRPQPFPSLPVMRFMAEHSDEEVRHQLAWLGVLPPSIHRLLVDDPSPTVRVGVIWNSHPSNALLKRFATHPETEVRVAVAARATRAPRGLLARLALDPQPLVRREVAFNPSTPRAVLTALTRDSHPSVLHAVLTRPVATPAVLARLATHPDPKVRAEVAAHEHTLPVTLTSLAQTRNYLVRAALARNANTPPKVLTSLSRSRIDNLRWFLARNPALPVPVLARLAVDPYRGVRSAAAQNPCYRRLPDAVLVEAHLLGFDTNQRPLSLWRTT